MEDSNQDDEQAAAELLARRQMARRRRLARNIDRWARLLDAFTQRRETAERMSRLHAEAVESLKRLREGSDPAANAREIRATEGLKRECKDFLEGWSPEQALQREHRCRDVFLRCLAQYSAPYPHCDTAMKREQRLIDLAKRLWHAGLPDAAAAFARYAREHRGSLEAAFGLPSKRGRKARPYTLERDDSVITAIQAGDSRDSAADRHNMDRHDAARLWKAFNDLRERADPPPGEARRNDRRAQDFERRAMDVLKLRMSQAMAGDK